MKRIIFFISGFFLSMLSISAQDNDTNSDDYDGNSSDINDVDSYIGYTDRLDPFIPDEPDRIYAPDSSSTLPFPVGSPSGSFSVSPLGAATYSVKIDVPSGRNGMQPDVSLVYNSQGGNDVAGWGFGISGMSSIRFVPKDIYHDGVARGVTYTWDDPLALDGRRLILKTGTHGVTGAVYTLEGDPFTTVTLKLDSSTNKQYFEVRSPDGRWYEYGLNQSLHTVTINNEEHIVAWYLRMSYDSHWNAISCTYVNDNNFMYLNGFHYHGRAVNFQYENRTNDPQTFYIGGVQCKMRKRLKTIVTKEGDNIYRTYTLNYNTTGDLSGTKYSRLVSVTESNASGESLQPISIDWNHLPGFGMDTVPRNLPPVSLSGNPTIHERTFFATDMNGDGISDLVHLYLTDDTSNSSDKKTHVLVRLSVMGQNGEVSFQSPIDILAPETFINSFGGYCHNNLANCDIDGDGKNDLCIVSISGDTGQYHTVSYSVITGGSVCSGNPSISGGDSETTRYNDDEPLYTICDFDNDGRSEIFHIEKNMIDNEYRGYYFFNTDTCILHHSYYSVLNFTSKPKQLFSGDFNNDGLSDIVVFCESEYKVFFNRGVAHDLPPFIDSKSYTSTDITDKKRIFQGDFNGDGQPDFIMNGTMSLDYFIAYCNGNGSFTLSSAIRLGLYDQCTYHDDDRFTILVTDLDHDGMSDLMLGKATYNEINSDYLQTEFRWLRSTGTGFVQMRASKTTERNDSRPNYIFTGDFTGNGQTEIMNYGNNIYSTLSSRTDGLSGMDDVEEDGASGTRTSDTDDFYLYTHTGMNASSGKARTVTDGFGNVTSPLYASLTNGGVYTRGTSSAYPLNDISAPLSVVSGYTTTNGAAGNSTQSFLYGGLRSHVAGKGLLGFTYMTFTDSVSGKSVRNEVLALDSVHYEPLTSASVTSVGNMSSQVKDYYRMLTGNNSYVNNYVMHKYKSEDTDIYGNKNTTFNAVSEAYGYSVRVHEQSETDNELYKELEYDSYVLKGGAYRPTGWHSLSSHPDTPNQENRVNYTASYNNTGDRISYTENAGNSLARTTTYTYDVYGNLTSEAIQTTADSVMTTTYTYSDGRYLLSSSTNPTTSVHTYTYDTWGNPLTHTETIGDTIHNTTVNTYDGWGNLIRTVSPEGHVTTFKRGWGNSPAKRYYLLERRQGMPWKKTWYDSRGREVLVESVGPDHIHHDIQTIYDSRGLVTGKKEILGLRETCDTLYYDALGRVVEERHTGNGNTTYSYADHTVTSVKNGITTVTQNDPWGNVKSVNENGVYITYTYDSNGKPRQITSAGHTVSLTYDNMGRRLSLTDPDAGTSTWQYDRAGNVTRHVDARNKVTVNNYFATGNLRKSVVDGVDHWYKYDPTWTMLEEDWKIGFSRRFWHDRYGKVYYTGKWKSVDGTVYSRHYYDSYGRHYRTWRSHGPAVDYTFDDNGFRTQVKVGNKIIWRLVSFTGLKEKCYTLEDSLMTIREFDHAGRTTYLSRAQQSDDGPIIYRTFDDGSEEGDEYMDTDAETEDDSDTPLTVRLISPVGNVDTYEYTYDPSTGNLTSSSYSDTGLVPTVRRYTYDNLDRLIKAKKTWHQGIHIHNDSTMLSYGTDGNILSKTGIGAYTYGSNRPHAVTGVANTASLISHAAQSVTYNSYGKASHIDDGDYSMDIDYGPERQRWKSVLTYEDGEDVETVRSVRYHDDKEIITEDGRYYSITYLDGGVICVKNLQNNAMSFYQTCADVLGNVTKIVKGDRTEIYKADYDEWGRQTVTKDSIGYIRGYTGHEMLPEFGLVNMNGRMYDPLLGRFLSPDDYVQMPTSPQGFNRYAYCMNNPMKYVDPSGELAWFIPIITGAVIGATTSAVTYAISACITKNGSWSGFFKSVGMGALGGAISGALGSVSMSTALGKFSNSLGFNLLGQTSSSIITNFVFGNEISIKDLLPAMAGAIAGYAFPKFTPFSNNTIANAAGEMIHNTIRGGVTGFVSGIVSAGIYNDPKRVNQGLIGGAISGFSKSLLQNLIFGAPMEYAKDVGNAKGNGVYRKGVLGSGGLTLGRYMVLYDRPDTKYSVFKGIYYESSLFNYYHEWYHVYQQYDMGWANFYGTIIPDYINYIFFGGDDPYNTIGHLDYDANTFAKSHYY